MRILLAGGGTGGPAVPLIAVAEQLRKRHPDAKFLLIGSGGPEQRFAFEAKIPYTKVPAGKWRRYFTLRNLFAPFEVLIGFIKSVYIVLRFRPQLIFSAGGFVAVPVVLAGWFLRKKILVHQQDVEPSMTNRIIAPLANAITVTFEGSLRDFSFGSGLFSQNSNAGRISQTGNPVRESILNSKISQEEARAHFGFNNELPIVLITGGATGASSLNAIILQALPELVKLAQVIHSTGSGKQIAFEHPNYRQYQLLSEMADAYSAADIVVARAGLSSISELSALAKVSIVIPMPNSHQLYNAKYLDDTSSALILDQLDLNAEGLVFAIRRLVHDLEWQQELSDNIFKIMPHDAAEKIAVIIERLCQNKKQ